MRLLLSISSLTLLLFAGCQSGEPNPESCEGAKCDTPGDSANDICRDKCGGDSDCFDQCREDFAMKHCEARRDDALSSSQRAFTKDAIRWACSDVEGVNTNNGDDRGQEYCEYMAIIAPPPEKEGEPAPSTRSFGRRGQALGFELTEDQIFALEDEPDAVVGQCLFTSWHQDIRTELPVCQGSSCPTLTIPENAKLPSWATTNDLGYELSERNARMEISINSNSAAVDLLERCVTNIPEVDGPDDPLNDNYLRGCMQTFELFQTEWRRSDPTICTVAMRLGECGCGVDTDGDGDADLTTIEEIARGLVPRQPQSDGTVSLRGFKLGTWSGPSELPTGCRYVETGEDTQVLVECDLTAADLLTGAADPKAQCRAKYGDNVVVHIPVPAEAIVCTPDTSAPHTDTCGDRPWEVGNEGQSGSGGEECCKVCVTSQACGNSCISKDAVCNQPPGCACQGEPE